MNQPIEHYSTVNGVRLCWFEWNKPTEDPTILLVHATGFHARCWDQVVHHLGDRHVISLDQRSHGRSEKTGAVAWPVYGEDLVAFIADLKLENLTLVGHSMGGYCSVLALTEIGERLGCAVLVDPVVFSPDIYAQQVNRHESFLNEADEHPVARRRNHFVNAEAMYQNFEGRGSYASWTEAALRDYCEWGLLTDEEQGGYKLACPPSIEASIYMGSQASPIVTGIGDVQTPVTVLRAIQRDESNTTMDFTRSPTWPELANQFPRGRDVYLPELTHFMPMQDPKRVADYILGTI